MKCDFSGFREPEMVKTRWVTVISPKFLNRPRLATVVALSTTVPDPVEKFHYRLTTALPHNESGVEVWAKCAMVLAASFNRLNPWWRDRSSPGGKRMYVPVILSQVDIVNIQKGLLYSIGLGGLTAHFQGLSLISIPVRRASKTTERWRP